jgi:hypothetical protein
LLHQIYPSANAYLENERGLTLETLRKFRVGVGSERFRCDETGNLKLYDTIYFPVYREHNRKVEVQECEFPLITEQYEPVRFKVRAVGKEHKSKQRFTPNTSQS